MLTISLKAHWQVRRIMLSGCWLHIKQPQSEAVGAERRGLLVSWLNCPGKATASKAEVQKLLQHSGAEESQRVVGSLAPTRGVSL